MGSNLQTRPQLYTRVELYVTLVIVTVFMIVGSVADLDISTGFYESSSSWGVLLAGVGESPVGFALVVVGAFMLQPAGQKRGGLVVAKRVGGGFIAVLGTAFVAFIPTMYLSIPVPVIVGVAVVLCVLVFSGAWWLASRVNHRALTRAATGLIVIVIAELVIINLMKVGWSRPRMRMLIENSDVAFRSWWQVGSPDKAAALNSGIKAEEFKSFPSGHAANAAVAMYLLPMLAWISQKFRHLVRPAFYVGLAWAVAVALSRIVVGAHFVTDVAMGITVTLGVALLVHKLTIARLTYDELGRST